MASGRSILLKDLLFLFMLAMGTLGVIAAAPLFTKTPSVQQHHWRAGDHASQDANGVAMPEANALN
jgi:hypothetical protein